MSAISIAESFETKNSSEIECVIFSHAYNSHDPEKISKAEKLLTEVHDGIYVEHFPLEDEQEPVDVWQGMLEAGDKEGKHVYIAFGKNLDSDHPQIMGFVAAGLYDNSGLIEYIIRTKDAAAELRGTEIVDKAIDELKKLNLEVNGTELNAVYWELNDPKKVEYDENNPDPTVDCMSPQKRLELVQSRYNGKLLGFDYAQAPLTEGQNVCSDLRLARIDVKKPDPNESQEERNRREARELRAYLRDFTHVLTERNPDEVAIKEPKIRAMFNQVDLMIAKAISPPEERQTQEQKAILDMCNPEISKQKIRRHIANKTPAVATNKNNTTNNNIISGTLRAIKESSYLKD